MEPVDVKALRERAFVTMASLASTGAEMIAAERGRQQGVEGWTPEHDDEHLPGELSAASRAYSLFAWWQIGRDADGGRSGWSREMCEEIILRDFWPWDERDWKPSDDPERNLVKAGALIAAEIDRLQRATSREQAR